MAAKTLYDNRPNLTWTAKKALSGIDRIVYTAYHNQ